MNTHVPLDPAMVEELEPTEQNGESGSWISPFAVPRSAEADRAGPDFVRGIRFHYMGGDVPEDHGVREPLDQRTDPEVELIFTDPTGKVQSVRCKSPADAGALERVADRLTARAQAEKHLGRRFSILMIARILKVWASGMQLWACGGMELKPRIGQAGQCRVVVIDSETQRRLRDKTYCGIMENPQQLLDGQVEVTWTEGGGMRIIGAEKGAAAMQRWRWSQNNTAWGEGGCPPDQIVKGILTAMKQDGKAANEVGVN
jgi:hypothetical protein